MTRTIPWRESWTAYKRESPVPEFIVSGFLGVNAVPLAPSSCSFHPVPAMTDCILKLWAKTNPFLRSYTCWVFWYNIEKSNQYYWSITLVPWAWTSQIIQARKAYSQERKQNPSHFIISLQGDVYRHIPTISLISYMLVTISSLQIT